MKAFVKRMVLFSLPVVTYVVVPCIPLILTGENFKNIDDIIVSDQKYLLGYRTNEVNYHYIRWKKIQEKRPFDVISVGTSRALQFRQEMFDSSFYNAGFTVTTLNGYLPFVRSLPEDKLPKFLIMPFDQWMFNAASDHLNMPPGTYNPSETFSSFPKLSNLKAVWIDILQGSYGIVPNQIEDGVLRVGLAARVFNRGLRNDGSMQYGIHLLLNNDSTLFEWKFRSSLDRIAAGNHRFQYGDTVNHKAVKTMETLLSYCRSKNIKVIGIIPPLADALHQKMDSLGRYGFIEKIYPTICEVFKKYDHEIYDFIRLSSCGSDDEEMLDGTHASEVTYVKMLIHMLDNNSSLSEVVDVDRLKKDLKSPVNQYQVYAY